MKFFIFSLFFVGSIFSTDFNYRVIKKNITTTVHVLEVNPENYIIRPVLSSNQEESRRESVLTIAKRVDAIAAINGGFWKANGDPAGILKSSGVIYGQAKKLRGAIGWSEDKHLPLFDKIATSKKDDGTFDLYPFMNQGDFNQWNGFDHVVGGAALLIKDNEIISDYSDERIRHCFLHCKHARTAIGVKENGNFVFVVVDGFTKCFCGITITNLARLMKDLGCISAVNLDGGSSSTMVVQNSVVNNPHGKISEDGKKVVEVSDAIVILSRK